ncbi:MAG TPA: hypothetical protein VHB21_13175 [Minicystis sp.]|nr:hypothetical protein [Minicystis sp.]
MLTRASVGALFAAVVLLGCGGSGHGSAGGGGTGGTPDTTGTAGSGQGGGGTGGVSSTGGGGAAPGPVIACAPAAPFDDAATWIKYAGASAVASVDGAAARIVVDDGSKNPGYAGFQTPKTMTMHDCGVWVRLTGILETDDATAVTFFSAPRIDGDHVMHMFVEAGTLYAHVRDRGTGEDESAGVPYDPAAHRVLRIREDGGLVRFEASADGHVWNELLHATAPSFLSAPIGVGVGAGADETAAGMPWVAGFEGFDE